MFNLFRRKKDKGLADVFHDVYYKSGLWKLEETGSGPGSTLEATRHIREQIPVVLKAMDAKKILDAPCGDFNWMSQVALGDVEYTGADIISKLIATNRRKFPGYQFIVADITRDDLPQADLVLCRDCFIHLPNALVQASIANFKRNGIGYLLTNTYDFIHYNADIDPGEFRMLNLRLPPFSLPDPVMTIDEEFTDGYPDKKLCLWKL